MALWQYNFLVLPNTFLEVNNLEQVVDEDGFFDDEVFWLEQQSRSSRFDSIEKMLPKGKSWSDRIKLFGQQESNRFEVYLDESNWIISVSFRIDFTTNYEPLLRGLIEFFIQNDLVVLNENLQLVPLNFLSIKSVIENAPQVEKYRILSGQSDKKIDDK